MNTSLNQIVLAIVSAVLFVAIVIAGFFLYSKYMKPAPSASSPAVDPAVAAQMEQANKILAASPDTGLPGNTGVNRLSATTTPGAIPEGQILFSASVYGDQSYKVKNYRLDIAGSLPDPDKIAYESYDPATNGMGGWLAAVDDTVDPGISFYIVNAANSSQFRDGHRELPRSIMAVNAADGSITLFDSVLESEMNNFDYAPETSLLAFTAWKRYSNPLLFSTLDNWKIVILNTGTRQTSEINGAHNPLWLPGGTSLIYMKKDGAYMYDMENRTETLLYALPSDRNFYLSAGAALSPDKSKLVLTSGHEVGVYDVNYQAGGRPVIEQVGRYYTDGVEYYWPIFSPDSKYYALQAINVLEDGHRENPRVEIREVGSIEPALNLWMGNFLFETTVLNEWVAK